jgi:hypothetical protein
MAALERIPIHNPASHISTEQPIMLKTRGFPQRVVIANEEPSLDLVVNPSLLSPYIKDPWFTGEVENAASAPIFMPPRQNDPGFGDLIASMDGSLGSFSTETPENHQDTYSLLGTLLHSWRHSIS